VTTPYAEMQFIATNSSTNYLLIFIEHMACTNNPLHHILIQVLAAGAEFDDASVSPVVRQTLQHWAYRLTKNDCAKGAKRVKARGAA
jgi:hypothetical protein